MKPFLYKKLPVILGITEIRMSVLYLILTDYEKIPPEDIEAIRKFHQVIIRTLNFRLGLTLKEDFWEYDDESLFTETDQQEIVLKGKLLDIYTLIKKLEKDENPLANVTIEEVLLKGRGEATYENGEFHILFKNQKRKGKGKKSGETTEATIVLAYA